MDSYEGVIVEGDFRDGADVAEESIPREPETDLQAALRRLHGADRDVVLVADDNATNRMVAEAVLGYILPGHQVVMANDGSEALDALRLSEDLAARVALLFTDFQMPKINGMDLAGAMRGLNGHADALPERVRQGVAQVPVVLYTADQGVVTNGHEDFQRAEALRANGALHGVLLKPAGIDAISGALLAGVNAMLDQLRDEETN